MRYALIFITLLCAAAGTVGCTKDDLETMPEPNASGETRFQLAVASYEVKAEARAAEPSANPEPESDEEKAIRDFWLFQFNPDGSQLAAPAYYALENYTGATDAAKQTAMLDAAFRALTRNTPMTIYIVTNTGDATWASGDAFNTLDKVKAQKLSNPRPIHILADPAQTDAIFIPMSGQLDGVTVTDDSFVVVPVTRMYAKVKIQATFHEEGMTVYDADVKGIPWYCRVEPVGTLDANGEPAAVPLESTTTMVSRAFSSSDAVTTDANGTKWLVLYMPENLRGEIADADKKGGANIPEKSLEVHIRAKHAGMDYNFTVYPGGNTKNNFNIRRNCVYRVTVDVKNAEDQHNPSSNCYVVKPNDRVVFEPYNRAEEGGGYNIKTYLDPTADDKKIASVEIIWQTHNCIGDNSDPNNPRVWITPDEKNPINSKITVLTNEEGNALVGARNSQKQIIWSWHIWVTPNEPDNLGNAVVYTTYRWDAGGIYANEPRIPGYGIMPCNIGALAFRSGDMGSYSLSPETKFPDDQIRTFGMLYQWGRKDPFPPMIYSTGTEDANGSLPYSNDYTETHYANDNKTIVNKSSGFESKVFIGWSWSEGNQYKYYLFYSKLGGSLSDAVKYSIQNPTVYITGTSNNTNTSLHNSGDWCPKDQSSDRLWGATASYPVQYTIPDSGNKAHLRNNYGTKSIFDPCPAGWRVAPGDLWLGFTKNGLNPTDYKAQVNYSETETGKRPGMSMFVQAWQDGPTVYFPLQGTRIYNGDCKNTGLCGNYHNATCDDDKRVNLLHLHRNMAVVSTGHQDMKLFKLFEYDTEQYYIKSTAGPIRCVRDAK